MRNEFTNVLVNISTKNKKVESHEDSSIFRNIYNFYIERKELEYMTKKELIKERKIYRKEMRKLIGDLCLVSTADKDVYETKQKLYLIKSLGGKILFLNKEIKKSRYFESRSRARSIITKLYGVEEH